MRTFLTLLISCFVINFTNSQATTDFTVQLWAEVNETIPSIKINWNKVNGATGYSLYKKTKSSSSWGIPLTQLSSEENFYIDNDVVAGTSYEYRVDKAGNVAGFGYINSGIKIEAKHKNGIMLLLVDSLFSESLKVEIDQLKLDLAGDGWFVIQQNINRQSTAIEVKNKIVNIYNLTSFGLTSILCLGHIPVPYSGDFAPDGHVNNHEGAWPADGYYGDMNGTWLDNTANNTTASQIRNHNIPGDGKFDDTYFPSDIELQVGRIDFANLPVFSQSEETLLRAYLNKNHAYKMGEISVRNQAIIDDNFGGFNGESFAGSAWKSCSPLLGPEHIFAGDYRTSMDTTSYIWSYGCGAGSYTSCSGVGTSAQLATDSLQGIFSSLFGSYFGDWDSSNNLLRASLAQGTILTNCWNGRPHWSFHHMGLGENIGYSTKISMNNNGSLYNTPLGFLSRIVSMGLMGDPSLRMYVKQPVKNLVVTSENNVNKLSWNLTNNKEDKFFIYKSESRYGPYFLLNQEAQNDSTYLDICNEIEDTLYYMVRPSHLEITPSGSFYNLGTGKIQSVRNAPQGPIASITFNIANDTITFENNSSLANTFHWDFGDENTSTEFEPEHIYDKPGEYIVTLIARNDCFETAVSYSVQITFISHTDFIKTHELTIYPTPTNSIINIKSKENLSNFKLEIFNIFGQSIYRENRANSVDDLKINIEHFSNGTYILFINSDQGFSTFKILKQ